MPIDISSPNGTMRRDTAERFQIDNLLEANEDVHKMQIKAYFVTSIYLGSEKLSEMWNEEALIFDCENDPELEAAMHVIQTRIGQKRYLQITTPAPVVSPGTGTMPSPT